MPAVIPHRQRQQAARGQRGLQRDVAPLRAARGVTEGDPALYEPLVDVVRRLWQEVGMREVEVISRHPQIGELAPALAQAGVTLFNVSLDTLDADLPREIGGIDHHAEVLSAIKACVATGVPVKLNVVVMLSGRRETGARLRLARCRGGSRHPQRLTLRPP